MFSDDPMNLQENFLKLLSAEIKWQDPTDPVDAKDFTQQLSSLVMVAQSSKANSHLEKIAESGSNCKESQNMINYMSYIDKEVVADTSKTNLSNGSATCYFKTKDKGEPVYLSIYNKKGEEVMNRLVYSQNNGINNLEWDGRDESGRYLGDGEFYLKVADKNGLNLESNIEGQVQSIQMFESKPYLEIDGALVSIDQILKVSHKRKS